MATYEIIVTSDDYQNFDINIENTNLSVTMRWNLTNNTWVVSISDGDELLVSGRQARVNQDLLANAITKTQLLFIGETLARDNLGDTVKLYLVTE